MKKVFLLGHTGSLNRGCEAIVRSTVKLLKNAGVEDIYVAGLEETYDRGCKLDQIASYVPCRKLKKYSLKRIFFSFLQKCLKIYEPMERYRLQPVLKLMEKDDVVLIVGGDTYCYQKPSWLYAYNRIVKKKGAKSLLWGCSIEKDCVTGEMLDDLRRYDYIFPREQLSYQNLLDCGIAGEKLVQMSDPAFNLEKKPVKKYDNLDNVVGINMSPIVTVNETTYRGICDFVSYIAAETDMKVLLIPHVYDSKKMLQIQDDVTVLAKIKQDLQADNIEIVREDLTCEELKYIISKCRLFVGARTHSTIAAYSSCVPTLVLGYSVKSRGIARDLFRKEEGYVMMHDAVEDEETLKQLFISFMEKEDEIRELLTAEMPAYQALGQQAAEKIRNLLS